MATLDITPVVEKSTENKKGVLEFTLKNTNVSIVNAIKKNFINNYTNIYYR